MLQKSMMKETKMTQIHHLGNLVSLRNSNVEKRTQKTTLLISIFSREHCFISKMRLEYNDSYF